MDLDFENKEFRFFPSLREVSEMIKMQNATWYDSPSLFKDEMNSSSVFWSIPKSLKFLMAKARNCFVKMTSFEI
jgi:hypothetical protein